MGKKKKKRPVIPCNLERFGPILHSAWKADESSSDVIIGFWAEDFSRFEMKVPVQLRSFIIELQNRAHSEYLERQKECQPRR